MPGLLAGFADIVVKTFPAPLFSKLGGFSTNYRLICGTRLRPRPANP